MVCSKLEYASAYPILLYLCLRALLSVHFSEGWWENRSSGGVAFAGKACFRGRWLGVHCACRHSSSHCSYAPSGGDKALGALDVDGSELAFGGGLLGSRRCEALARLGRAIGLTLHAEGAP